LAELRGVDLDKDIGDKINDNIAFPDRDVSSVSPQVSMLYHFQTNSRFTLICQKSFRAPTLNELYRSFRVAMFSPSRTKICEPSGQIISRQRQL